MKTSLSILILSSTNLLFAQTSNFKLLTPGEHLGYTSESFSNDIPDTIQVRQNETWTAVYVKGNRFKTRKEIIGWDSLQNLTIQSESDIQPLFYIQGLDTLNPQGFCSTFKRIRLDSIEPPIWKIDNAYYFITYTNYISNKKIKKYNYGSFTSERDLTILKSTGKNVFEKPNINYENSVHLIWTGDINSDKEPDFLIAPKSHHETIILEFIISKKSGNKITWGRVARFTEWF